jgi:DnaJ-class molecular chaperone
LSTEPPDSYDPQRCSPCRGTGSVISALGGTPKPVTCPWCEGSGRFIAEHDAQAARREQSGG